MTGKKEYRGMHSHTAIEIATVKSGVLKCHVNNEVIELTPNQIIFVNSNTRHMLYSENAEIIYCQVDMSLLEENSENSTLSKLYPFILHTKLSPYLMLNDNTEMADLLDKVFAKYSENSKESYWYIKAYLYEIVAFMYAHSVITPFSISKEQFNKIQPVIRFVDENFKSQITLDQISAVAKYNKYTICHTFKEITGATIFEYINFSRVRYAAEKLKDPKNTILEIATECGFCDAAYFNRVFKKIFGCAPSVYRKLLPETLIN